MEIKACCCTGHRDISADKIEFVKDMLLKEIIHAVDDGFSRFISGMANGTDVIFAEIVTGLKKENRKIILEAAILYRKRMDSPDMLFQQVIGQCDTITVLSEAYSPKCFGIRNRYIVDNSQRVIAVFNGRTTGGTFMTINYARSRERDLRIIKI